MNQGEQELNVWLNAIRSGAVTSGRWLRMAVERHFIDLERAEQNSAEFPYFFNAELGETSVDFFHTFITHVSGVWAGKPFYLSPIQRFMVFSLMGWRHRETGLRRFKRFFYSTGRKNGKTTFASALALLLFAVDTPFEVGAEVYCCATTKDQASILHTIACKMILQNESLRKRFKLYKHGASYSAIVAPDAPHSGSVFRPIGSDSKNTDGLNISVVIKDEIHAWRKQHRGLKDKVETASGSRRQPLDITISTNGDEQSIFFIEDLAVSQSMLNAVTQGDHAYNDQLFSIVLMLDEERPCSCSGGCDDCDHTGTIAADDPFDESCWIKANPDLDITTPSLAYMREQAKRAKQEPSFLNNFKRYHCNLSVSSNLKLIDAKRWSENGRESIDWSAADKIVGAFDLGFRDDFAAVAIAGRFFDSSDNVFYAVKCRAFCCEQTERRNLTSEPFASWIRDGWLRVTPGSTTDFLEVKETIVEWREDLDVVQWRFDPANARQLGTELAVEHGVTAVEFYQNHSRYNEPLRDYLAQIKNGLLLNERDPVLAWMAGNLVGEENNKGQLFPSKGRSADKIDGQVAAIMAFSGCRETVSATPEPRSDFYENNTLEEIVW